MAITQTQLNEVIEKATELKQSADALLSFAQEVDQTANSSNTPDVGLIDISPGTISIYTSQRTAVIAAANALPAPPT